MSALKRALNDCKVCWCAPKAWTQECMPPLVSPFATLFVKSCAEFQIRLRLFSST